MRILFLEDEPKDAELVETSLQAEGIDCDVTRVDCEADFLGSLQQGVFDVILADYTLPSFDGISALRIAQRIRPEVPFIFVSGTLVEEIGIEALKQGATDYVSKARLSRIVPSVRRAMREAAERRQRRQAEQKLLGLLEELKRNETWLEETQALTHTGSFVWDVHTGKALYLSNEWYRVFGFSPGQEAAWEQRWQRVHPEDCSRWRAAVDRAIDEKRDYRLEERLLLPDGAIKNVRAIGHPVLNASGDVVQFMGSVTDITDRKRVEQLQADLAHVNRVSTMGELAASIAHELKQPFTGTIINASTSLRWLQREPPNIEEASNAIRRIVECGERAGEIIDHLQALYKKAPSKRESVLVNEIIGEMVALLLGEATLYSVSVRADLAGDLPNVIADRVQIQQVLMNLMINGIEAMKDTGGVLTVKSQLDKDAQILISVSDSGRAAAGQVRTDIRCVLHNEAAGQWHGTGHQPVDR